MHELPLASPRLGEEGREIFERAHLRGDVAIVAQLRVDTTLQRIRKYLENSGQESTLEDVAAVADQYLADSLKQVTYESSPNLVDYYHLKIKHALIRPIVFAEKVFQDKADYEARRELTNGIYGDIAAILQEAIEAYDSTPVHDENDRGALRGVINELTALALLNRNQAPESLTIPSEVTADLYHATDLEHYAFEKGETKAQSYHIQVKTSVYGPESDVEIPTGGILIAAKHFLNTEKDGISFPTSRAIIGEVDATDTDEQAAHLSAAAATLSARLKREKERSHQTQQAIRSLPPEYLATLSNMRKQFAADVYDQPDTDSLVVNVQVDLSHDEKPPKELDG